ncbi:P-loop containing nucleoside triphosphate hydrolase protein [Trametes punicea]|nr:P-loop containing nucleoside triphosphate hydrolase protein [Trametes punicea]
MRRLLSLSRSSARLSGEVDSEKRTSSLDLHHADVQRPDANVCYASQSDATDDEQSTAPLLYASTKAILPPANLKIKRVDYYYSTWSGEWKYRNTVAGVNPEALLTVGTGSRDGQDPWQSFCFVVVRKVPYPPDTIGDPVFVVVVKSPYLLIACKAVIGTISGMSWNVQLLELDPHLLLAFLPQFEKYRESLRMNRKRTNEETNVLRTVEVLISYLRKEYKATLAKVATLTSHGEISFDTLFAIFVPRTIVIADCPMTGEPCAFQLVSITRMPTTGKPVYDLICESVDLLDDESGLRPGGAYGAASLNLTGILPMAVSYVSNAEDVAVEVQRAMGKSYGRIQTRIVIGHFSGTVKISSLDVYPLEYHPDAARLRSLLVERGRKWLSLRGIHHMQYDGVAVYALAHNGRKIPSKHDVKSRIVVDRGSFRRWNPRYDMPVAQTQNVVHPVSAGNLSGQDDGLLTLRVRPSSHAIEQQFTEEELIMTPPVVYGFSLADKMWFEFNVRIIQPINWSDEAFENLVLPPDRKALLQSLVEAYSDDHIFDDFVYNKGRGLVVNLFGSPGVGKTLSAEATSEHVRRPLYVVGAGELGTTAAVLDTALNRVFDLATRWKAIVLIDEADVFLEQRSLYDIERNAMVAVFLRHIEYYRGILFLTTNRVRVFDEAFLSRIHVALHFQDLTKEARRQVWTAFLRKIGVEAQDFGEDLINKLAEREVNGRQIKNAVRTASSLALKKGVATSYAHLTETLNIMEGFTAEFAAIRGVGHDA